VSTIELNGARVISGTITIPFYGAWVADVILSESTDIPTSATLTVGDLTLRGTVVRQASFSASRSARIVGGAGGWRKPLSSKGYSHAAGVKMSTLLADAAGECGERIVVDVDRVVGPGWARESAKAERLLHILLDGKWWIDPDGVTQTKARISTQVAAPFTVISWSGGKGLFEIATESIASWQPGRTFSSATVSSVQTVSSVTIESDNEGKLRLHVLSVDSTQERLRTDLRSLIRQEIAALSYFGVWEYTITSGTDKTVDAVPTDSRMPSLTKCPMMPGLMGEVVTPAPGSKCRIAFVNGDPSRYECIGIIGTPIKVEIAGPIPTQAAARFGDAVSGVAITSGSTKVFIGG
jgi:hypothetical protein